MYGCVYICICQDVCVCISVYVRMSVFTNVCIKMMSIDSSILLNLPVFRAELFSLFTFFFSPELEPVELFLTELEIVLAELISTSAELNTSWAELELIVVVIDLLRFELEIASIEASVSNFCITDVADIEVSSTPDSITLAEREAELDRVAELLNTPFSNTSAEP